MQAHIATLTTDILLEHMKYICRKKKTENVLKHIPANMLTSMKTRR